MEPEYIDRHGTNLMEQEIQERKRLTYGSRHRVNGSHSKRCTLPSDHLTAAQKKKLNGEVFYMGLDNPMKYAEFQKMSEESQREYIQHLRSKYGFGMNMIAKILGISYSTMRNICKRLNIRDFKHGGSHAKSAEQEEAFERFLSGADSQDAPASAGTNPPPPPENEPTIPAANPSVILKSGRLIFSGSVSAICNSLLNTFGKDTVMTSLDVRFRTGGE